MLWETDCRIVPGSLHSSGTQHVERERPSRWCASRPTFLILHKKTVLTRAATSWYFRGGGQNACNFLYLTTKHVFEIFGGGAIARLPRPLVAGLVFTAFAFTYRVLFINSCISVHFSYWFLTIAIVFLTTSFYMSLLCQVYCSFRNFWSNEFSWNKVVRGDSTGPPSGTRSEKGLNRCSAASEQLCTGIRPRNVHSSHWR